MEMWNLLSTIVAAIHHHAGILPQRIPYCEQSSGSSCRYGRPASDLRELNPLKKRALSWESPEIWIGACGLDIVKSQDSVILVHDLGWNLFANDLCKNTVFHHRNPKLPNSSN
jgi:hypothetical protein